MPTNKTFTLSFIEFSITQRQTVGGISVKRIHHLTRQVNKNNDLTLRGLPNVKGQPQ